LFLKCCLDLFDKGVADASTHTIYDANLHMINSYSTGGILSLLLQIRRISANNVDILHCYKTEQEKIGVPASLRFSLQVEDFRML
jgi:hypothetical protein